MGKSRSVAGVAQDSPRSSRRITSNGASTQRTPRSGKTTVVNGTSSPLASETQASKSARRSRNHLKNEGNVTAEDLSPSIVSKSSSRKRKREETVVKDEIREESPTTPRDTNSKGLKKARVSQKQTSSQDEKPKVSPSPKKNAESIEAAVSSIEEQSKDHLDGETSKTKRKRKTKEEKEAEAMPIAIRTPGLKMFIGAHVSCAKGVHNSVTNSLHIGGNAFAMFLKSQRKWENPPLQDDHRDQFKSHCTEHHYDALKHVLPHGSYLVNLAQADTEKAAQAYAGFIDDLHRCDALGIRYYNFHPGTTGSHPRPAAISRIASALNRAITSTHTVVPVLETMATAGSNVVGSSFEDIRDIISGIDNKDRIGVCIDTCHIFAAGYDLRQPKEFNETLQKFDEIIGMQYLKALHINDSKAPLGAGRDLHQNIGLGFLGLRAFHNVVNEKRFEGLPLILETPIDNKDENGKDVEDKGVWAREIKMLESLIGMDPESKEFKEMERQLADKGAEERKKYQDAFQRKKDKIEKGQTKLSFGKKAKKKAETDTESEN